MFSHSEERISPSEDPSVLPPLSYEALAKEAEAQRTRADRLELALESNRTIGIAMGILMHRHKVTAETAFGMLRDASQHWHRKLRDVAEEVARTGELSAPG
jgi:AmiR/NasT family two-component response regulator